MSLDLPAISQPFPDALPFFDIRQFLANGWTSAGAYTFAVRPDGNALDLMLRVRGDNATSSAIAEGIPISPAYGVRFQGHYSETGESVWISMSNVGRLVVSGLGGGPFPGEISAIVRMPMKK